MTSWSRDSFAALYQHPPFRILWLGASLTALAFFMSVTVQSVLAFDLKGNNSAVGIVNVGLGLSLLIVGPFGGVIADRVSKRRLLLLGQSVIGLAMLALGLLVLNDRITIAFLALGTFTMGAAFAFIAPARQAYVGTLVGPKLIANAVALTQTGMNIGRVAGPLLGGLLVAGAILGPGGTYLVMSSLIVVVMATLWLVPESPGTPPDQRRSVGSEFLQGLRYVRSQPPLRFLMLLFIGVIMISFGFLTVLPGLLENELNRDAEDMGMLLAVEAGAGLLLNLFLAGQVGGPRAWSIMLALAGLLAVGFFLLATASSYAMALVAMIVFGPGLTGFMLTSSALLMANTERAYYGRVMSLTLIAFGLQGTLALPIGVLADAIGERETLALEGSLVLAMTVIATAVYLVWGRRQPPRPRPPRPPRSPPPYTTPAPPVDTAPAARSQRLQPRPHAPEVPPAMTTAHQPPLDLSWLTLDE